MSESPFWHYNTVFDPVEVVKRHAVPDLKPDPDHVTNFLGVKVAPKFFPGLLDGWEGRIDPPPLPANWHADVAEWGVALRAVDMATDTYRVVELGCGWGCWLLNTGVAAKRAGLSVELIGVEGDLGHVRFAHEAMKTNGISEEEYRIVLGVAAASHGKALFPSGESGASWGNAPVFGATPEQIGEAEASGSHDILEMFTLEDLALREPIDLLHIDIQGGETDYVRENIESLNRLVRRMVIGTHSRQIEGELMAFLLAAGWQLEIERPAIFILPEGRPHVTVDGLQGWVNPNVGAPPADQTDERGAVAGEALVAQARLAPSQASVAVGVEHVFLAVDHQPLDLEALLVRVGRRLADEGRLDAFGEVALCQAGAVVAPGLADLHRPGRAVDVDLQRAVRVAERGALDRADELDVVTGGPAPAVMGEGGRREGEGRRDAGGDGELSHRGLLDWGRSVSRRQ